MLIFSPDAPTIAAVIAAVADQPLHAPRSYTRLDGSETPRWTIPAGGVEIEVQDGEAASPALITLTAEDPDAAVARALAAGAGQLRQLRAFVQVGPLRIQVVPS